jgi:predicted  nucleic acid-binding Zn-ribbon protein
MAEAGVRSAMGEAEVIRSAQTVQRLADTVAAIDQQVGRRLADMHRSSGHLDEQMRAFTMLEAQVRHLLDSLQSPMQRMQAIHERLSSATEDAKQAVTEQAGAIAGQMRSNLQTMIEEAKRQLASEIEACEVRQNEIERQRRASMGEDLAQHFDRLREHVSASQQVLSRSAEKASSWVNEQTSAAIAKFDEAARHHEARLLAFTQQMEQQLEARYEAIVKRASEAAATLNGQGQRLAEHLLAAAQTLQTQLQPVQQPPSPAMTPAVERPATPLQVTVNPTPVIRPISVPNYHG